MDIPGGCPARAGGGGGAVCGHALERHTPPVGFSLLLTLLPHAEHFRCQMWGVLSHSKPFPATPCGCPPVRFRHELELAWVPRAKGSVPLPMPIANETPGHWQLPSPLATIRGPRDLPPQVPLCVRTAHRSQGNSPSRLPVYFMMKVVIQPTDARWMERYAG